MLVVVGSSCFVTPAADIPRATKNRGGRLVTMNIGETGVDDIADVLFRDERVGELLPALLEHVRAGGSGM